MNNKIIKLIEAQTKRIWIWKPGYDSINWEDVHAEDGDVIALSSGLWDINIGKYENWI